MTRWNAFKVALLGVTALTLVACGEAEDEVLAYDNVEACIAAGQQDAAVCRSEFAKAQKLHAEVAPRYRGANQCYSDFGYNRCYQSGGSMWLPFMMGYMLAPRGGMSYIASQPLYRSSANPNSFYTASSQKVGAVTAGGRTRVASSQVRRPAARTRTVSRGGFGSRAAGRSAGG
jgi:uncharacterized protein YgiB involved in biofilm formation